MILIHTKNEGFGKLVTVRLHEPKSSELWEIPNSTVSANQYSVKYARVSTFWPKQTTCTNVDLNDKKFYTSLEVWV